MQTFSRRHALAALSLPVLAALCWSAAANAQPRSPDRGTSPVPASSSEPVFRVVSPKQNELQITERFAKVVETKARIVRVDGFDPAVIGVTALTPNSLRVQGLAPGVTTMVIVDENAATWLVDVFVTGDVRHLQAYLDQLYPQSSVEAVAVRDAVVLRGWVAQPEQITNMVEVAEQFYPRVLNQMQVGGVQQVMLKVRVMEVQRSKIRRLGINFLYKNRNGYLVGTPGALVPLATTSLNVPAAGAAGITPPAVDITTSALRTLSGAFGIVGDSNVFEGFIDALKSEALLKILAEPELTTTNGRPSNMLAGGEFPILVPQSLGTTTIQWREFGVRLEAVPLILGNGRVRLELQPEVSERDFTNAVQVNGFTVPGLTTRRVNTQVEMRFGETFMLAGLLSMRNTATTDKVPVFGELPWIGSAFRRVRYDEAETELVIMVTPELVNPLDPAMVPPGGPGAFTSAPTDRELYINGMIEVPNYGDECVGCSQGHVGHGPIGPGGLEPVPDAGPRTRAIPLPGDMPPAGPPGLIPPRGGAPLPPLDPNLPLPPAPSVQNSDETIERTGGVRPKFSRGNDAYGGGVTPASRNVVPRNVPPNQRQRMNAVASPQSRGASAGLIEPR